jgi:hypothetical protein
MQQLMLIGAHRLLEPEERERLGSHLAGCGRCREEERRLERLLGSMQPEGSHRAPHPPALFAERNRALQRSLQSKGRLGRSLGWAASSLRPVTLAAAAGIFGLMLIAGYWTLRTTQHEPSPGSSPEQVVSEQDEKVIESLDFFQEMDTIQKLVRITNDSNEGESGRDEGGQSHGSSKPLLRYPPAFGNA